MKLSPGPLLQSLIKTILVPLLCGAAARAAIPGERGGKSAIHLYILQGMAYCNMRLVSACWPPLMLHHAIHLDIVRGMALCKTAAGLCLLAFLSAS